MNKLAEKSLKTLEYFAVLELLSQEASSSQGKQKCMALRPTNDLDEAQMLMKQTSDAKNIMIKQGSPSLSGIREVTGGLKRAEMGGVLNLRELLNIASVLQTTRLMQTYFSEQEEKNSLTPIYRLLAGNTSLEQRITTSILSEEEVADGASSELANIRRQMRQISGKIRDTLSKLISGERSKYLQETIITQRNGRYVVPVKAEHRADVAGLVHDTSASGATVFVEPAAVVEINNQMKLLEGQEQAEIERILAEMSAEVSLCAEAIRQDLELLVDLDFIFARAKLSFRMNADAPNFKQDGYGVNLKRARHPLLDPKKAVAIDIAIGNDYDTLVVTGPNTGGKTVSLKTIGLLSLMSASGMHIPASELSEVCVFENVYADIGDEQSIEQSLSTFSSHMKTIVGMMEKCSSGDLVLFDELGAGTDPIEGAALAVSVISYARQMGAFVVATTHYSELKTFALTTDGVENASCEFDVGTLRPTYRLLTGIPGKSNAFAIASRLGLQPAILEKAKEQLSSENTRFEDVLAQLEKERRLLEKYKAEAERLRSMAQSERDKAENLRDKSEDEADRIVENARLKADRILKDARMTAETVFSELDEMKKKSKDKNQNLSAAKAALRGVITQTETELRKKKEKRTVENVQSVSKGDEVQLINISNIIATVLTDPDSNGNIQVQAGIMKTTVNINEVKPVKKQAKPKTQRPSMPARDIKLTAAKTEVDVRGMCAEEAILEVDQFLSNAMMSSLGTVRIIHGKGTGTLRNAIQQHLKRNKRIKTVRNGVFGEGENGVTVVEFK